VLKSVAKQYKFPARPGLFKIDRFGGWAKVDKQFFDPTKGIMAQIQRKVGQG
jgi:ABC-type sulfate transport system substrate-binding protein